VRDDIINRLLLAILGTGFFVAIIATLFREVIQ
jgi:hypothetical protein